jgi:hypothetical protein
MKEDEGTAAEEAQTSGEASENLSLELEGLDVDSIMESIESRVDKGKSEGIYRDLPLLDLEEERTG